MDRTVVAAIAADAANEQKMDSKHCALQCREWIAYLDRTYMQCLWSAKFQDQLSLLSSGVIIVLNVIIIGANELKLQEMLVSLFVIIMSVLKAFQLKFEFEVCSSELHSCKAGLRAVKINVKELCNEAECTGDVKRSDFNLMKDRVSKAIAAVPNYISVEPRPEGAWPSFMSKKAKAEPVVAPGAGKDTEADVPSKREMQDEGAHLMMPPQVAEVAEDAQKSAADVVLEVKAQALAAKCEVEKVILADMLEFLKVATPQVRGTERFMGWIIGMTTTVELTLNAVIMAFENLPALAAFGGSVIAICASVNAVQKGLMLKLDLDVKRKTVQSAHTQMKELLLTAKQAMLKLETTGEVDSAVLDQMKKQFSKIIQSFSAYLPQ